MTTSNLRLILIASSLLLVNCGGGSGDSKTRPIEQPSGNTPQIDDPVTGPASSGIPPEDPALAASARYHVTLENLWGVEDYPQGFPDDAHLSLIGGATHNAAVSFWEPGEPATRGIEDMAEAGLIDKLLFDEVAPAIDNGTADSMIEIREYTKAKIDGVVGIIEFDIAINKDWPLVSMVTMLGPSPDWFVGVSGLSLQEDDSWLASLTVDLPLYDGGTKSDITPIMGGPDILPGNPIALVAYEPSTGVYLPATEPQIVARVTFKRLP